MELYLNLKSTKVEGFGCSEHLENVDSNETDSNTVHNDKNLNGRTSTARICISNEDCLPYTQECAVYIYSICFSTIISCSYWKNQTLSDIIEHAIEMYNDETINGKSQPSENFPGSIQILI